MKKPVFILTTLMLTLGLTACAEFKSAGRDIGHATKEVTTTIGHTSRDIVNDIGDEISSEE
ncbi:hypothetical protein [Psychromonas ossibalaenae]|uniref:hypothetical protein n=1 Tax=Psychromonas ossibalaenae TaxID=444922 RepID=UPI00036CA5C9|nr:hypothetical protein [Psychromonas ossibalaenae]